MVDSWHLALFPLKENEVYKSYMATILDLRHAINPRE